MRKPILFLAACAVCFLAVGPAPRYLESLRIGGGYGSTPDGGADFEADGDILTDGGVTAKGTVSSGGFADSTLAAHWPLADASGTTARDIGPYDHPGTIVAGSGGWTDDSPYRHAYNFSSTRIECGAAADLDSLGPQTITAWIKPLGWGGNNAGMIVSKNDATLVDAFFMYQTNACLRLRRRFTGGSGQGTWRSATNSIALNRWQFVAVTYDHSSASNDPVFYVNGVPSTTTEETAPSGLPSSFPSEQLLIGNTKGYTFNFSGRMADVRVYRRVLTSDDIAALYRASSESPSFQTLSTVGAATICGGLDVGVYGSARGVINLFQGGANVPGCVRLMSPGGTSWYLFVRDDGTLKIHSALPTVNTDGAVVGGQS
ncbi:MAG: LamG domain-containing protein [FCB group bacterium]|jgi:hypothetical protein|nr:LamG domain-containing protein [FCB group bacterium]